MTAAAREPVLSLRALDAGRAGVAVVHGVDLHVGAGEVVALLGANGAGKTTTLLTVAGLLPPLGGTVEVLGEARRATDRRRPSARVAATLARRGLALVPEDRGLFFGLTGHEHLRLAARRHDGDGAIHDALEPFPVLREVLDRRAGQMSGGEQQMLAVARALVARPQLLMIDELSLGLAPAVVEQLLPTLRDLARERAMGALLVEQHTDAALSVADRAYVLTRGRVAMEGAAADLAADRAALARTYLG